MYFRDIVGQDILKNELINSFQQGLIPHARLFVGEDGMGALSLAYAYARYINCNTPYKNDACGNCSSCLRYNDYAGQDLIYLFPIVNISSRNVCEDELTKWRSFLSSTPHNSYKDWLDIQGGVNKRLSIFAREGERLFERLSYQVAEAKYRIILIWLPERMHETLANKLLKLTEEPPHKTIILMVCEHERAVLPTLRSRMQVLHLQAVDEKLIDHHLRLLPPSPRDRSITTQEAAHLAQGNYRKALDIYTENEDASEYYTDILKRVLRSTVNAQPHLNRSLVDEISKLSREEQINFLEYIATFFREVFISQLNTPNLNYIRSNEKAMAQYIQDCITPNNLTEIQDECNLAIRHITQNVSSKMVFFDLLLRLTSILAKDYKRVGIR